MGGMTERIAELLRNEPPVESPVPVVSEDLLMAAAVEFKALWRDKLRLDWLEEYRSVCMSEAGPDEDKRESWLVLNVEPCVDSLRAAIDQKMQAAKIRATEAVLHGAAPLPAQEEKDAT